MYGELQEENDLFFTCSLIEYIARQTKNTKRVIVDRLGVENIKKIYELADVYHCENIDKVCSEFVEKAEIEIGNYDKVSECNGRIPTYWEIGKVYKRLILMVDDNKENYIETLMEVLASWIIDVIDNYNCSMYYESPEYIYKCYKAGKVL